MRLAGDRFHDLFVRAALDPLRAADCSRIPSRGKRVEHFGGVAALRRAREAMEVRGGIRFADRELRAGRTSLSPLTW